MFAYRSTDPQALLGVDDPIGPENDRYITNRLIECDEVICAWGSHKSIFGRQEDVVNLIRLAGKKPLCLATTKNGTPRHPLYLRADLKPVPLNI
jgi:hypothetical protein